MQDRPAYSEIQDSLRVRLGAAARRFRLAAMLAAGCEGLAVGALAGLTLVLGGWLGPAPWAAAPPLVLALLAVGWRIAMPRRRGRKAATLWIAAGLAATASAALGLTGLTIAWALAAATAMAAAAAAWTPDARRLAAGVIDRRFGLAERLVTAEELLGRPRIDEAEGAVIRQASGAWPDAPVSLQTFWPWGLRAPTGALLAVAALSVAGAIRNAALTAADEAAARARTTLAERVTADAAALGEREQRELAELARLLRVGDEQAARQKLIELRRLGYRPLKGMPAELLERARLAALAAAGAEEPPTRGTNAASPARPDRRGAGPASSPERVLVYTPAPDTAAEEAATRPVGAYRPLADAWARARAEADDALAGAAGRSWPAEYRTLLRRYFSAYP